MCAPPLFFRRVRRTPWNRRSHATPPAALWPCRWWSRLSHACCLSHKNDWYLHHAPQSIILTPIDSTSGRVLAGQRGFALHICEEGELDKEAVLAGRCLHPEEVWNDIAIGNWRPYEATGTYPSCSNAKCRCCRHNRTDFCFAKSSDTLAPSKRFLAGYLKHTSAECEREATERKRETGWVRCMRRRTSA